MDTQNTQMNGMTYRFEETERERLKVGITRDKNSQKAQQRRLALTGVSK